MTPHFNLLHDPKLACSCGCGMLPALDFMGRVEHARILCENLMREDGLLGDFGWTVSSAARCPTYNSQVSGTGRTGPHTTGRAIDIACQGAKAFYVQKAMYLTGFTGIGTSQKGGGRFVHGDDLKAGRPYLWSY